MPQVHIVIDSTANAPSELIARENLHIVPLTVRIGFRQWQEQQLSAQELFDLVRETGEFPKTSQPAPGDYIRVLQPLVEQGDEVVIITVSSGLSGTMQSARTAASAVNAKKIHVVDSGTTAIGMVKMAELALSMAEQKISAADIAAHIEQVRRATRTIILPGTLEYLHKGGRIGGAAALMGTILSIRPVLHLVDGKVAMLDKVRTWSKATNRIADELKQHTNLAYIGVVHLAGEAEALKLHEMVVALYPNVPVTVTTGASVLAAHLGPGLTGLIFQDSVSGGC